MSNKPETPPPARRLSPHGGVRRVSLSRRRSHTLTLIADLAGTAVRCLDALDAVAGHIANGRRRRAIRVHDALDAVLVETVVRNSAVGSHHALDALAGRRITDGELRIHLDAHLIAAARGNALVLVADLARTALIREQALHALAVRRVADRRGDAAVTAGAAGNATARLR